MVSRRGLLKSCGLIAAGGLAGCIGDGSGNDSTSEKRDWDRNSIRLHNIAAGDVAVEVTVETERNGSSIFQDTFQLGEGEERETAYTPSEAGKYDVRIAVNASTAREFTFIACERYSDAIITVSDSDESDGIKFRQGHVDPGEDGTVPSCNV